MIAYSITILIKRILVIVYFIRFTNVVVLTSVPLKSSRRKLLIWEKVILSFCNLVLFSFQFNTILVFYFKANPHTNYSLLILIHFLLPSSLLI